MGGFHIYHGDSPYCFLLPGDVIELVRIGVIVLPSSEEIDDRSTSDWVAKALALVQALWFVMQVIARPIEDLRTTQLEIATIGYTALIGGIYFCWWSKPRNVNQPIRIPKCVWEPPEVSRRPRSFKRAMDIYFHSLCGKLRLCWRLRAFIHSFIPFASPGAVQAHAEGDINEPRVPRFFGGDLPGSQLVWSNLVVLLVAILFGAIHFSAVWLSFPTPLERNIWLVSSSALVILPLCWAVLLLSVARFLKSTGRTDKNGDFMIPLGIRIMIYGVLLITTPIYVAARVLIIGLAFSTLRSLHPSAYEVVHYWTIHFPHFF